LTTDDLDGRSLARTHVVACPFRREGYAAYERRSMPVILTIPPSFESDPEPQELICQDDGIEQVLDVLDVWEVTMKVTVRPDHLPFRRSCGMTAPS
jgi:hypothetical protein